MNAHLEQLYQEMILDHNKKPRNFGELSMTTHSSHGHNPLCGDDYRLFLHINDEGMIQEVGFLGDGCAISKASASLMTTMVKGKSVNDALTLARKFAQLVTEENISETTRHAVGRLKIFEGVKNFPVRVKCAMLIWRTLEDAAARRTADKHIVSTE